MTQPNAFDAKSGPDSAAKTGQTPRRANADHLTSALQQSFQATVDEAVPDSLMDLLNQLK